MPLGSRSKLESPLLKKSVGFGAVQVQSNPEGAKVAVSLTVVIAYPVDASFSMSSGAIKWALEKGQWHRDCGY